MRKYKDLCDLKPSDYIRLLDNCTKAFKEELECKEKFYKSKIAELEKKKKKEMKVAFCFKDLRKNVMDELKLAYLAGVKVGIESLVEGLKITAGKNGNQLPIEFVKLVAENTITDVELKLTSMENGKGLLDVLDSK